MAGVVGFEPTVHGTKNRCLTAWLHPNSETLVTVKAGAVQAPSWKEMHLFFRTARVQQIFGCFHVSFRIDNPLKGGVFGGIHSFDDRNSPLFSSSITSLSVDDKTGDVWFGTSEGIESYRGIATSGSESFESVYTSIRDTVRS